MKSGKKICEKQFWVKQANMYEKSEMAMTGTPKDSKIIGSEIFGQKGFFGPAKDARIISGLLSRR